MNQPADQLQATLDQLHDQLAAADADLDQVTQARLQQTLEEIRRALDKPAADEIAADDLPADETEESFSERLLDAQTQFEQSHPTLAGTVRRLVDVLAQMGI